MVLEADTDDIVLLPPREKARTGPCLVLSTKTSWPEPGSFNDVVQAQRSSGYDGVTFLPERSSKLRRKFTKFL